MMVGRSRRGRHGGTVGNGSGAPRMCPAASRHANRVYLRVFGGRAHAAAGCTGWKRRGGGSSDAVALQYHDAGNHPIEVGRNGATPAAAGGHQLTSIRERERCRAAAIGEILSGCATPRHGHRQRPRAGGRSHRPFDERTPVGGHGGRRHLSAHPVALCSAAAAASHTSAAVRTPLPPPPARRGRAGTRRGSRRPPSLAHPIRCPRR